MTNSQRLATVRARLLRWLAEQQAEDDRRVDSDTPILRESILIRNEFYCGRRFHTADFDAVWFIEEDQLKIYHSDGQLACSLSGDELNVEPATAAEPDLPQVLKMPEPDRPEEQSDGEIRRAA